MLQPTKLLGLTTMILSLGFTPASQAQAPPIQIINQNNSLTNHIISTLSRHHSYDHFFLEGKQKLEIEIKNLLKQQEKPESPILKVTNKEKK